MDVEKMIALVATQKIPSRSPVKWSSAEGQHWPLGEKDTIAVFQVYCECKLRLPSHPLLAVVFEHFGVE